MDQLEDILWPILLQQSVKLMIANNIQPSAKYLETITKILHILTYWKQFINIGAFDPSAGRRL